MAEVTRLLTFVDLDDRDARGLSLCVLHQAVLDDGRRVVLLHDRGWSSSRGAAVPAQEIEKTARAVVGPDEPFGDLSQTDMERLHWQALVRALHEHGVVVDVAMLSGLPHDVELSSRLERASKARPTRAGQG